MKQMNWDKLISVKRTGQENKKEIKYQRTQFQRDFDRLIFSSPFRRLQDKTQVFPLPGSIFVHNRLTHSLEVSGVGRSLGYNISNFLLNEKKIKNELIHEIDSIVAAACLAHDLGNPPFGHSGESAISEYFIAGEGKNLKETYNISDLEWNDLIDFEGNANALRLLTHKFAGRRTGGFSLTYPTVASIIKYPYRSGLANKKKYGFFQSEKDIFLSLANNLGLIEIEDGVYCRHPLVYLVEAADDICYLIMDVEDAHKLKILDTTTTKEILMNFLKDNQAIVDKINKEYKDVTDTNEQIALIRAYVIGKMVNLCTSIFIENYDAIMSGTFQGSLMGKITGNTKEAIKECKTISVKKIYAHQSVVEIEISGFKILGTLIHEFITAVFNPEDKYSSMLLNFMPKQYRVEEDGSGYDKIQSVLDFISGMTDVYALNLYRKINGIGFTDKGF